MGPACSSPDTLRCLLSLCPRPCCCARLQIGGALVGPHALNIISDVHAVQHLAELGVVFLLFNIGLELSLERLQSMAKYVFGMGAAQVGLTVLGVAGAALTLAGLPGPSAIILGGALAMSTTAVAIQVLEDRGEMGSRCACRGCGGGGSVGCRGVCWCDSAPLPSMY